MSVREQLNAHPKAVAIGVAAVTVGLLAFTFIGQGSQRVPQFKAYYTDDDGKTTFIDTSDRITPFDHDGKPAVRARLFTFDGGKTVFVGYLERYTESAAKALQTAQAAAAAGQQPKVTTESPEITIGGTEIKRPGDTKWIRPKDMAGRNRVTTILPPAGQTLDAVQP